MLFASGQHLGLHQRAEMACKQAAYRKRELIGEFQLFVDFLAAHNAVEEVERLVRAQIVGIEEDELTGPFRAEVSRVYRKSFFIKRVEVQIRETQRLTMLKIFKPSPSRSLV